ncbi:hypothetical protein [Niabella aquatica]
MYKIISTVPFIECVTLSPPVIKNESGEPPRADNEHFKRIAIRARPENTLHKKVLHSIYNIKTEQG